MTPQYRTLKEEGPDHDKRSRAAFQAALGKSEGERVAVCVEILKGESRTAERIGRVAADDGGAVGGFARALR